MLRLDDLNNAIRKQFVFAKPYKTTNKSGERISYNPDWSLETNEEIEGNKSVARVVFVGLAEMYGFQRIDVANYLGLDFDVLLNYQREFRNNLKEVRLREATGTTENFECWEPVRRFGNKVGLVMNYIRFKDKEIIKLKDIINE